MFLKSTRTPKWKYVSIGTSVDRFSKHRKTGHWTVGPLASSQGPKSIKVCTSIAFWMKRESPLVAIPGRNKMNTLL